MRWHRITLLLKIERCLGRVSGEAGFAQEQRPVPARNSGNLPDEASPDDSLGSEEGRSRFFPSGNLIASRVVAFDDEGKKAAFNMQRIFRTRDHASSLINTAPERQPYRNEREIKNLFKRLAIPMKELEASGSCHIVQI
jgi:hypothetical protein